MKWMEQLKAFLQRCEKDIIILVVGEMVLSELFDLDIINPIYIYCFGLGGIVIYLLIIVLAIVFIKKAVGLNYFFGYRTSFSLSSSKKWEWANNIYVKCVLIGEPIFLIIHTVIFILSAVFSYFFLRTILTMALGLIYFIPIVFYIEIYGRIKFKNDKEKPLEPLIENEQSKKQDIDDFWK